MNVKAATQVTTSQLITYLVGGVGWKGAAPCRYDGEFVIDPDPDVARQKELVCDLLKGLLWFYVIDRPAMASQQHGQARIIRELLSTVHGSAEELLPPDRKEDLADHKDVLRASTDYVASLTEQDAEIMFHRLTGVRIGALTEALHT